MKLEVLACTYRTSTCNLNLNPRASNTLLRDPKPFFSSSGLSRVREQMSSPSLVHNPFGSVPNRRGTFPMSKSRKVARSGTLKQTSGVSRYDYRRMPELYTSTFTWSFIRTNNHKRRERERRSGNFRCPSIGGADGHLVYAQLVLRKIGGGRERLRSWLKRLLASQNCPTRQTFEDITFKLSVTSKRA